MGLRLSEAALAAAFLVYFLLSPLPAFAQGALPSRYTLPGDTVFPEGITLDPASGDFYVGSTTDGAIFRGNVTREAMEPFLAGGENGRTAVTGMKVDDAGRLFVSGGGTGKMFVYDTATKALLKDFQTIRQPTFVNDVALVPSGDAYFTDSNQPVLYRVTPDESGSYRMEEWIDFTGTPLAYQTGFNVNGIAATPDGRYLIVVQSNTGKLFRIETATKAVIEIPVEGGPLTAGDGLLLRGNELFVVRNSAGLIAAVRLIDDFSRGHVVTTLTGEGFDTPTTLARHGDRLLVVIAQFSKRGGTPSLPFTVAVLPMGGLGDVDKSGQVDIADLITVIRAALGAVTLTPEQLLFADTNGDGSVDLRDVRVILRKWIGL